MSRKSDENIIIESYENFGPKHPKSLDFGYEHCGHLSREASCPSELRKNSSEEIGIAQAQHV